VEDNPANLLLVRKILSRRADIELLSSANAEDGLVLAEREHPALILLDINLPGMDGFEALRRLRENPATREIPVIAVTANAMKPDIERGRQAGFADYVTKPIQIGAFLSSIEYCLAQTDKKGGKDAK
jgi:CheY-like chemotaxis protein